MTKRHSLFTRLSKLSALSMSQWVWLVIAIYKLLYVSLLIRMLGFKWIRKKILSNNLSNLEINKQAIELAEQLHEVIRLAARCLPLKIECLPKAIVLADMLRKHQIPAKVKLGVNKSEENLYGHAWVTISGENISESKQIDDKFTQLTF